MWMMGYNDGVGPGDSFSGRKLRSLMPRPAPTAAINNHHHPPPPPCLGRIHATDHLLSFNHHLAAAAAATSHAASSEQNKRDFVNAQQQVVVSSRWNPTPEQLQTLEELYRRGTRTPSADQIQHITAQLRRYGKIEGKNVFYWFQNHKARERQKRRRQIQSSASSDLDHHQLPPAAATHYLENHPERPTGANGTGLEVERTKNWPSPTNSSTLPEKTVSIPRAAKAANPECRSDGWVQFDEELAAELQQRKSLDHHHHHQERNATWHMMQFFGSSSPTCNHLINSTFTSAATTTTPAASATTILDPKHIIKPQNYIFLTPYTEETNHHLISVVDVEAVKEASNSHESQTLQLFPLQSSGGNQNVAEKEILEVSTKAMMNSTTITPHKFFEFLPLKN